MFKRFRAFIKRLLTRPEQQPATPFVSPANGQEPGSPLLWQNVLPIIDKSDSPSYVSLLHSPLELSLSPNLVRCNDEGALLLSCYPVLACITFFQSKWRDRQLYLLTDQGTLHPNQTGLANRTSVHTPVPWNDAGNLNATAGSTAATHHATADPRVVFPVPEPAVNGCHVTLPVPGSHLLFECESPPTTAYPACAAELLARNTADSSPNGALPTPPASGTGTPTPVFNSDNTLPRIPKTNDIPALAISSHDDKNDKAEPSSRANGAM